MATKWDKDVKDEVKMLQGSDYEIKEDTPTHVLMEKNTSSLAGHAVVFVLFGWWTLGIANLVYWYTSKKHKKVMK